MKNENGWTIIDYLLHILVLLAFIIIFIAGSIKLDKIDNLKENDNCPTISIHNATGNIRCWSNNHLVYNKPSYYNGGILCSFDGYEIKLNKSNLCIVESNQLDIWSPPI